MSRLGSPFAENKKRRPGVTLTAFLVSLFYRLSVALAAAYKANISPEALPDGKMYYNIAQRILQPTLGNNHEMISAAAAQIQTDLNQTAGIGLAGLKPELSQDRIDGLINRLSSSDEYGKVAWLLDEPIVNFSQSVVDDTIKLNAEFQAKSGLQPRIIRKAEFKSCKWCSMLAGTYSYPDVPKDVYRRHENCRCTVEFQPTKSGKGQDVWSKQWKDPEESAKIEARKQIENEITFSISDRQFGKKAGKHMQDYGLNASDESDRKKFEGIIHEIANNPDRTVRGVIWRGQTKPVVAYVKADDVVLANYKKEFITIMKGGADNARLKNQGKS
ncbi:MAG: hypothetical protein PHP39_06380 [Oscillospiraceae bacterium]|nr:hypothetical protein [Oscillospiraceae bacterium]